MSKIGHNIHLAKDEIDMILREGARKKLERAGHRVLDPLEFQGAATVHYEYKNISPPAPVPTAEGDSVPPKPGLVSIKPQLQSCMITWED